jgi:hypothetical protein
MNLFDYSSKYVIFFNLIKLFMIEKYVESIFLFLQQEKKFIILKNLNNE